MSRDEFQILFNQEPTARDYFPEGLDENPLDLFVKALASGNYAETGLSGLRRKGTISDLPAHANATQIVDYQDKHGRLPRRISKTLRTAEGGNVFIHGLWFYSATGVLCDTFFHAAGEKHWDASWDEESFFCTRAPRAPGRHTPFLHSEEHNTERPPFAVAWWWERLTKLPLPPMMNYMVNKELTFSQLADLLTVGAPWT